MKCPNCGVTNRAESRFCLACGTRTDSVAVAPPAGRDGFEGATAGTPSAGTTTRRPILLAELVLGATLALATVGVVVWMTGDDPATTSSAPDVTSVGREEDGDRSLEGQPAENSDSPPTAEVTPITVADTPAPATIAPPAAAPPTTAPSVTATFATGAPTTVATTVPPPPPVGFPFPNAFEVPRLGGEPVRGTGCGADASIGDVVPDGWWFGGVEDITSASLRLDLVCAYFGDEASTRIAECAAADGYDFCTLYWGEQFWPVNNTERYRVVPVDPALVRVVDSTMGCSLTDVDLAQRDELTWVHIFGGRAVHLQHLCPAG